MNSIKLYTKIIAVILLAAVMFSSLLVAGGAEIARASSTAYSEVLDDLHKDNTFDMRNYPANDKDNGLQVIQIAESTAGELLIYVYQPAANVRELTATSINISSAIGESANWSNYKLELLNLNGVFQKYRVQSFELKADRLRYYDISSIFRKWFEDIDYGLPSQNENDINEVAFAVEQVWTVCTVNGEISYHMETTETIEITDKYVGYIRYTSDIIPPWIYGGFVSSTSHYDSHYIAFSTDKKIEELLSADIYYITRPFEIAALVPVYGNKKENKTHLTYKDKQVIETVEGAFWQKYSYTWDRIQSVTDFIKDNELTDEGYADLLNKQWVLRFTETTTNITVAGAPLIVGTEVNAVSILRLKFKTDGKTYNLGAIDNKQSPEGGQKPDNPQDKRTWLDDLFDFFQKIANFFSKLPWWAWLLIIPAAFIVLIIIVMLVIWLIKSGFKLIWRIISAPFRKDKKK